MRLKVYLVVIVSLYSGGCAVIEPLGEQGNIESWMVDAFQACVEAQMSISNPYWSAESNQPTERQVDDYILVFSMIPTLPVYHISISSTMSTILDLGGLYVLCRLDNKTNKVLRAAYFYGDDPGYRDSKQVDLVDHDPLGGISETELDSLIEDAKEMSFPLRNFLSD